MYVHNITICTKEYSAHPPINIHIHYTVAPRSDVVTQIFSLGKGEHWHWIAASVDTLICIRRKTLDQSIPSVINYNHGMYTLSGIIPALSLSCACAGQVIIPTVCCDLRWSDACLSLKAAIIFFKIPHDKGICGSSRIHRTSDTIETVCGYRLPLRPLHGCIQKVVGTSNLELRRSNSVTCQTAG